MVLATQIDQTVDTLFPQVTAAAQAGHTDGDASDLRWTIYPEELLHVTANANKYYTALQSFTRQFVDENDEGELHSWSIVQFSHSRLNALLRQKVLLWDDRDHEYAHNTREQNSEFSSKRGLPSTLALFENNTASSLFSWSSGDKYIAARKMELRQQSTSPANGTKLPAKLPPEPKTKKPSKSNLGLRLTSVVESESNRFIQDRIELIKAHHLEQTTKKIDERKKKDHQMHLRRVQLKEEKYGNILKAAIALQNTKRNSRFFGSLFGPRPVSSSFTLQITDADMAPRSNTQTPKSGLRRLEALNHQPLSPVGHQNMLTGSEGSLGLKLDKLPIASTLSVPQLQIHPPRSSTSSLVLDEYQSSTDKTAFTHLESMLGSGFQWPKNNSQKKLSTDSLLDQLGEDALDPNHLSSELASLAHDTLSDLLSL